MNKSNIVKEKQFKKILVFLYLMFLANVLVFTVWITIFIKTWMPAIESLKKACLNC